MARKTGTIRDELAEALARSAEPMPGGARDRVRARVMHAAHAGSRGGLVAMMSHRLAVAVTALAVLTGGVAYAAERSLPGDPLYGMKRGAESALIGILPPGELENRVLVGLAGRRAAEAARLARDGATPVVVDDAIGQLQEALREATSVEGPLDAGEIQRIRKRGADAPIAARKAIDDVVVSSGGSGTDGSGSGSEGSDGPGGATQQETGAPKHDPEEGGGASGTDGGTEPTPLTEQSQEASGTAGDR